MNLKTFLDEKYSNDNHFKKWKLKFPKMYNFASQVKVIPWQDEYAVADRNPEIIDEIKFYEMLLDNKMITEEEYQQFVRRLPPASKTLGVAFIEDKAVSFRNSFPTLATAIHELGHVYFRETDPVWSSAYGGGEELMWLIATDKTEGGEEEIIKWNTLMRMAYEDYDRLLNILDKAAESVASQYNMDIMGNDNWIAIKAFPNIPKRPIYGYMLYSGVMPTTDELFTLQPILVNIIEGVRFQDTFMLPLFKELMNTPFS